MALQSAAPSVDTPGSGVPGVAGERPWVTMDTPLSEVLTDDLFPDLTPDAAVLDAISTAWAGEACAWIHRCDAVHSLIAITEPETDTCSGRRGAIAELGLLLHVAPVTAGQIWSDAFELHRRPRVRNAVLDRRLTLGQARTLLDGLANLSDPAVADQILDRLLAGDAPCRRPPARLREWLHRQLIAHDPTGIAEERKRTAREQTGVHARPLPGGLGLAEAIITGPADTIFGIMHSLERLCPDTDPTSIPSSTPTGAQRTRGQLMLTTLAGIIGNAARQAGIRPARTELHLDLPCLTDGYKVSPHQTQPEPLIIRATPAGLTAIARAHQLLTAARQASNSNLPSPSTSTSTAAPPAPDTADHDGPIDPADVPRLTGYGPIDPTHAAQILLDTPDNQTELQVRRIMLDPTVGPCAVDPRTVTLDQLLTTPVPQPPPATDSYQPTAAQRRVLAARDTTCTFPDCTLKAHACDADHHIPWPRGHTTVGNLSPKSRTHHRFKHTDWTVTRHPNGTETWTSPHGREYRNDGRARRPRTHHRRRPCRLGRLRSLHAEREA